MKIALVHDYLAQDGGAERVLKAFHDLWPEAPIFVLFHDPEKVPHFNKATIVESWLAKMPFINDHFQWYLPWMPRATEHYNLRNFDVILSSASSFAKGVITYPRTLHISYCHTPTRFLWSDTHDYVSELRQSRLIKAFLQPVIHRLRLWDQVSAGRVDHFIANSYTVKQRIHKYYRRDSTVVYPPIDLRHFAPSPDIHAYFVAGGRLVPYKRLDMVIQVFNRLKYPLKIFGTGPEFDRLKKIACPTIEFLGKISDAEKAEVLRHAQAFIHPQLEDAGVTPLEAMASGRPVIAYGAGGAAETIIHGQTGLLFPDQTWESLFDTILHFDPQAWDPLSIRTHAQKFDISRFNQHMLQLVHNHYEEFKRNLEGPNVFSEPRL